MNFISELGAPFWIGFAVSFAISRIVVKKKLAKRKLAGKKSQIAVWNPDCHVMLESNPLKRYEYEIKAINKGE